MSPADKNRYPGTLRPSETSVREDFEATVAAAIARKNRYPEEQDGMTCRLGHRQHSYECPACAEAKGHATTVQQWRWFRGRTSSKRIKGLIDEHLAAFPHTDEEMRKYPMPRYPEQRTP